MAETKPHSEQSDTSAAQPTREKTIAMDEMPAGLAAALAEQEHEEQMEVARRIMRQNHSVLAVLAK